jgi:hypothetical protein
LPDRRAKVATDGHEGAGEDEAFSWTVEVAEEEGMRVVGFPGGEVHREDWDECCEGSEACCTYAEGGGFEEAAESAVKRVYTMAGRLLDVPHWVVRKQLARIVHRVVRMFRCGVLAFHQHCPWLSI